VVSSLSFAAVRLWAARRGHLALGVAGQLRHLLALVPLAVGRQHGHRHRRHRHGNGLSRLPGCHQGEQVPASEREFNPVPIRNAALQMGRIQTTL